MEENLIENIKRRIGFAKDCIKSAQEDSDEADESYWQGTLDTLQAILAELDS